MSWTEGTQRRHPSRFRSNSELAQMEGFLEEHEAKLALYEFLRNNITFATELLIGIKLFPFQHLAVKGMFETDYFLGVCARGMSKSFTTGHICLSFSSICPSSISFVSNLSRSSRWVGLVTTDKKGTITSL